MVANVNNGPGTSADPNYAAAIAQAGAAGATVYGYVYSSYAANSIASMEAQISKWKSLYGVTDIFIDEASTTASSESYYQTLTNYVHAQTPGSKTLLNFGTTPPQSDMNAGDILVTFEGDYSTYRSTTFPSWVENYAASRFDNIVYDVPTQAAMTQVLSEAQGYNVGYIYATNDTLPNPYDTVPPILRARPRPPTAAASGHATATRPGDVIDYRRTRERFRSRVQGDHG